MVEVGGVEKTIVDQMVAKGYGQRQVEDLMGRLEVVDVEGGKLALYGRLSEIDCNGLPRTLVDIVQRDLEEVIGEINDKKNN